MWASERRAEGVCGRVGAVRVRVGGCDAQSNRFMAHANIHDIPHKDTRVFKHGRWSHPRPPQGTVPNSRVGEGGGAGVEGVPAERAKIHHGLPPRPPGWNRPPSQKPKMQRKLQM